MCRLIIYICISDSSPSCDDSHAAVCVMPKDKFPGGLSFRHIPLSGDFICPPAASASVLLKCATSILHFCIYRNHNTAMPTCQLFYRMRRRYYRKCPVCYTKRISLLRISRARAIFTRSGMIKGITHMESAVHRPMRPASRA